MMPFGARLLHNEKQCFKVCSFYMSTIFALSSGQGKCGVAVIRVSGSEASVAVTNIAGVQLLPRPRQAILRQFRDPITHEVLDRGLLIWFPGPKSFSGEDSCEFQVHGGSAVISAMLTALGKLEDFRPAEPGEFTRRAFHTGKLDLTEVEGLADLIHAETEAQRKQALLQADGSLSRLYNDWRHVLIKSVSHVEAYIDFSEDENIESNVMEDVETAIRGLESDIKGHLMTSQRGERLREGVRTVIVGEPNAGKSTLLNALCNRPAAIVSPSPGTTRDVLELHLAIGGYPVIIADTAGLRQDADDAVEVEGIARAHAQTRHADLILLVIDATKYVRWAAKRENRTFRDFICHVIYNLDLNDVLMNGNVDFDTRGESLWDNQIENCGTRKRLRDGEENGCEGQTEQSDENSRLKNKIDLEVQNGSDNFKFDENKCLIVFNKIDLVENSKYLKDIVDYPNVLALSCKTEDGFPLLLEKMTQNLEKLCGKPDRESLILSQVRHRHHVAACAACLNKYLALQHDDTVLAAQQLRKALRHIGSITGHVSTEHILDVIFKDFCIGK